MDDEIGLKQAAELFGVDYERLRRGAYDGRLEARFTGNQYLVRPSEVERFLRDRGKANPSRRQRRTPRAETQEGTAMARTIAVAVPKGGTAKTTTVLNLGAALAEQGQRVLLVDLDPQGNLTQAVGLQPQALEQTVYTAMKQFLATFEPHLEEVICPTNIPGVDVAPTNDLLNIANDELSTALQREFVLRELLAPLKSHYDVILIDTLPYLGILVVNALAAADEVLLPLQAEFLATNSVNLILRQIQVIRRSRINPELSILGILVTMVDQRTVISRQTVDYIRKTFGEYIHVFDQTVKRSVRVPESQALNRTILDYDPTGDVADAYRALAKEVLHGQEGSV